MFDLLELNYYFFEEAKLTHPSWILELDINYVSSLSQNICCSICKKLTFYFFCKGTTKKKAGLVVDNCFGDDSFVGQ
jgi:hypothetical protein